MCNLLPYSRQSLCSYAPWQSCLPNAVVGKWNIDTKDPEVLLLILLHVWWQIQYRQKFQHLTINNNNNKKQLQRQQQQQRTNQDNPWKRDIEWEHSGQRLVCYQTWLEDNQSRDDLLSGPLWNRHFKCRYISVCPSFYCWVFLTTELHLFINHCETTFLLVVNHEEYEINLDILDYFPHFIDCSKIITNTNRVSATECVLWNEVARWLMDKVFTHFLRPFWLPWCWRWWQNDDDNW